MRKNPCLEIVAEKNRCNSAEEFIHIHMSTDPVLQLHIRQYFGIGVLTVRKNRNEHISIGRFPGIRIYDRNFCPGPVYLNAFSCLVLLMHSGIVYCSLSCEQFAELRVLIGNSS